jgi:hypothetical protein
MYGGFPAGVRRRQRTSGVPLPGDRFRTSRSPKSTRQRASPYAPAALPPLRPAQGASRSARNGPAAPGWGYRTALRAAAKTPGACRGLSTSGFALPWRTAADWRWRRSRPTGIHRCASLPRLVKADLLAATRLHLLPRQRRPALRRQPALPCQAHPWTRLAMQTCSQPMQGRTRVAGGQGRREADTGDARRDFPRRQKTRAPRRPSSNNIRQCSVRCYIPFHRAARYRDPRSLHRG